VIDVYTQAQRAAENRLAIAEGVMDAEYDGSDDEPEGADTLAGPYDGCTTCMIREVLDAVRPYFAWLAIEEGQLPDDIGYTYPPFTVVRRDKA
jgi:hypothetical protein